MSTQVKPRMLIFIDTLPTVVIWHPLSFDPTHNVLFIYNKINYDMKIPTSFSYLNDYYNDDSANVTFRKALKEIYPTMIDSDLEHLYRRFRCRFQGRHCNPRDTYHSPDRFIDSTGVFEIPLAMQPKVLEAILEGNSDRIISYVGIYNGDLL